jgi:hypothetical protein
MDDLQAVHVLERVEVTDRGASVSAELRSLLALLRERQQRRDDVAATLTPWQHGTPHPEP